MDNLFQNMEVIDNLNVANSRKCGINDFIKQKISKSSMASTLH